MLLWKHLVFVPRTWSGTDPIVSFPVHFHSLDLYSSIIFCEATAIYGVIIAIILQSKMNMPTLRQEGDEPINEVALYFAGYAVFGAGIAVGFTNIASGYVFCSIINL